MPQVPPTSIGAAIAEARRVASRSLLRDHGEGNTAVSNLELFFDLVFVFAITQVTLLILENTSPAGFARAALVLALVWWAWSWRVAGSPATAIRSGWETATAVS